MAILAGFVWVSCSNDPSDNKGLSEIDTDNDGLTDVEEGTYRTDPRNADTDGDGLSDYQELITYHTDALNEDSDSDGITDYEELIEGDDGYITNPLQRDSDADGVSDKTEIENGTNPSSRGTTAGGEISFSLTDYQTEGTGAVDVSVPTRTGYAVTGVGLAVKDSKVIKLSVKQTPLTETGALDYASTIETKEGSDPYTSSEAEYTLPQGYVAVGIRAQVTNDSVQYVGLYYRRINADGSLSDVSYGDSGYGDRTGGDLDFVTSSNYRVLTGIAFGDIKDGDLQNNFSIQHALWTVETNN